MLRDVVDIYRKSKKTKDINWFTEWMCRPVAAVFVFWLRNTKITPNQVTFVSAIVCAGACAMLLTLPGYAWMLCAIAIYELSFVLDCVDGQLARIRNTPSTLGHLFDFLMDELKAMMVYGCVAIRLWRTTGNIDYLLVGVAGLFALASALRMTSFTRRPEYGAAQPTRDGQPAQPTRRRGTIGVGIRILEFIGRTLVHYPAYIWIAAICDRLDIFFWIYGAINTLYLGRITLTIIWRMCRFPTMKASEERAPQ